MQVPAEVLPVSYVDGAVVPSREAVVSAFDRGFLVADGIFETFHVVEGVLLSLDAHMARLERSARFMRLRISDQGEQLRRALVEVARRNLEACPDVREGALRLTISRGTSLAGPPTVTAYMRRLSPAHVSKRQLGLSLWTLPYTRDAISDLAQHKTLSYLASSLGQVLIAERTDDPRAEGLFVTTGGDVLEGSSCNLFIVEGEALCTPEVGQGVLPGTSRGRVIDLANARGLAVSLGRVSLDRLYAADEVFVTSSTLHIAPAVSLDGKPLGGTTESRRMGPITRALQSQFEEDVVSEIAAFAP